MCIEPNSAKPVDVLNAVINDARMDESGEN